MSLLQPVLQPVLRPLLADPLAPSLGDGLTAGTKALFTSGEKGVMFDLSKASNLYTDSARTTLVSASGDAIGSVTDLSPNGKHASSAGTARPLWNSGGYCTFDALDDYLQTAAIDFSGTDKITVVCAERKASDAAAGCVAELSASNATNAGSFGLFAPDTAGARLVFYLNSNGNRVARGFTASAPDTSVLSCAYDIAAAAYDTEVVPRRNGSGTVTLEVLNTPGTGNFGNYPLFMGARNAASLFLNGRIYRLLVIGRALTTTERSLAERWAAQPAGIILP